MPSDNEKYDQCARCKTFLLIIEFVKNKSKKRGYGSYCKKCQREYQKNKFQNSSELRQKRKEWSRKSHKKNKQKNREYSLNCYYKNPEKSKEIAKQWRAKNKDKSNEHARKSYHKRMLNPTNRIIARIRLSLINALSAKNLKKNSKTFILLGYTKEDLVSHINKFINNPCTSCNQIIIQLDNSHIDHIKPISLAIDINSIIKLNQLNNLRLICATCNRKKWSHYNESAQLPRSTSETSSMSQCR